MPSLSAFFFFALPLAGLAHSGGFSGLRPRHDLHARNNGSGGPQPAPQFKLVDLYQGKTFFDGWNFDTFDDPTHGLVKYQSREDAFSKNLAFVQDDNTTVLAVDDFTALPLNAPRDSVRISSKKSYDGGLFIADIFAMPHGCSVWPAYWTVGPDWPNNGEIDVIEGVNDPTSNQMTLHTSDGCTIPKNPPQGVQSLLATGTVINAQCAFVNGDNSGCAFVDNDPQSHGHGFNIIAGGVYAHLWTNDSIKIWYFPRDQIPKDINDKNPDPSSWPTPNAVFTNAQCDISQHFRQHQIVINTTLCGDFAGGAYPSSGCPGTCAEEVTNPQKFKFAKWKINYVAVYDFA